MALRFVVNPSVWGSLRTSVRSVSLTAQKVLVNQPDSDLTSLRNGLRVASESNGRPTATIGVWVDAGSRFETEENNGVANFFEHMLYKGTMKKAESAIERELERIGARLSSYSTREHTALYAQCLSKDVDKVVGILAELLREAKLDDAEIEKEKALMLHRLDQYEDDCEAVVFDNLHSAAFQGTPLEKSVLGATKVIKSMNKKMLQDFVDDSLKPVRMVLAGVGGVEHGQLMSLADKHFGDMSNDYARKMPTASGTRFTGSEYRYRDDNVPLMYGAVAVEGVGRTHPDYLPLQVANTYIGRWDRTFVASQNAPMRLPQKLSLAENLHLYRSFNINYKDTGLFGIYFVLNGHDHDESLAVLRAIQKEWRHLSSSVTDDEMDRVKNMHKTHVLQAAESNEGRVDDIAKQVLDTGKIQSLASLEHDISMLDKGAMREAMSRHVYDRDLACAGVGRTEAFPTYSHLRYGMSWWRL